MNFEHGLIIFILLHFFFCFFEIPNLQPKDASQWSEFQQLPSGPVPAGHQTNDCVGLNDNRSRGDAHLYISSSSAKSLDC